MAEFDWDISKPRAEFLAEIANSTRRQHYLTRTALRRNQDWQEHLDRYESVLRSQLFELEGHVKDSEDIDNDRIQQVRVAMKKIDNLRNSNTSPNQLLESLEEIDQELQEIRIDIGLDIGKTEDEDLGPEDLYE